MLSNVAHFCRMQLMEKEALEAGEERRLLASKAATQPAPVQVRDAATQPVPVQVREAATQQTPVEVADDTQLVQLKAGEAFAQHTSGNVHQDVHGQSPIEVCEGATQRHAVDASEALSQKCPEDLEEGETEISLDDSYVIIRPSRAVWEPFVML